MSVVASASLHSAERRPNIVLIMADDFGYECVTANGGESYQTPHLDEAYLWQQVHHTRNRLPRYANPGLEHEGRLLDLNNGEYGPKRVNDFALDFITRRRDRPFFLSYPMILPHDPFQPTPDSPNWDPQAKGEGLNRSVKHFADMTAYLDKMVGRIVAKLDELGLGENTLVVFLADNGTHPSVVSRFNGTAYQGGKNTATARGTHVPLIARWPGRIPAGRVDRDLIASVDFLPTLCEAAGVKVPASLAIDGRSFFPQLLGRPGNPREWLYVWFARDGAPTATAEFAMNTRSKLYRDGKFHDLTTDPFEERPLAVSDLSGSAAVEAKMLQDVLDRYANARPPHLAKPQPADSR